MFFLLLFSVEREHVQKKTFTKWVNSHLSRINCKVTDLYTDLRDGKLLLKLLEILSGERLPRPTKGKMRIHCLENVDKALSFLYEQRVHLENMGAHDIVDGSPRLTLGLIWTIILRFQIQEITIEEPGPGAVSQHYCCYHHGIDHIIHLLISRPQDQQRMLCCSGAR